MSRKLIAMLSLALFMTPHTLYAGNDELRGDVDLARTGWEKIENGALLVDVRSVSEFQSGHVKGAINIPHQQTDALAEAIGSDLNRSVVFYCGSGRRVDIAIEALRERGYTNLHNASGFDALQATRPD